MSVQKTDSSQESKVVPQYLRWPPAAALLNASGLSLGYFYLKLNGRGMFHLVITAIIATFVSTRLASNAYTSDYIVQSLPFVGILLVWIAWMAFDGYRQAQQAISGYNNAKRMEAQRRTFARVETVAAPEVTTEETRPNSQGAFRFGGVVLALLIIVFGTYNFMAYRTYQNGFAAHETADCDAAKQHYDAILTGYHLSLSPFVTRALNRVQDCNNFISARANVSQQISDGRFGDAIATYNNFLTENPDTLMTDFVHSTIQATYLSKAQSEVDAEAYEQGIQSYQTLAIEYSESDAADVATSALATLFDDANANVNEGLFCDAGPVYTAFTNVETVYRADATALVAPTWYDCAASYRNGEHFSSAYYTYEFIVDTYPDSAEASRATADLPATLWEWGQSQEVSAVDDAIATYERLIDTHSDSDEAELATNQVPLLHYTVGQETMEAEDFAGALERYETILNDYPHSEQAELAAEAVPAILLTMGQNELEAEAYDEAIALFDRIITEYPDSPEAEEADAGRADAEVAKVQAEGTSAGEIAPPTAIGRSDSGQAVLYIKNSSPRGIRISLSGPTSRTITIPPCPTCRTYTTPPAFCPVEGNTESVEIATGLYSVVASASDFDFTQQVTPFTGTWILDGSIYERCFFIVTSP